MTRRRPRSRTIAFVAVGVLACVLGLVLDATNALKRIELDSVDARFDARGTQDPPDDIAVIRIDDITFDELNLRWPFPRSWHARAIDALANDGAAVIAYDIQFTEPSSPKQDRALREAAARAQNVVFATTEVTNNGGHDILAHGGKTGDQVLKGLGASAGISDLPLDPNGVVRRMLYDVRSLKAFSIVAAEMASGETITEDDMGGPRTWVDYPGPPGTIESYPFSRLVEGKIPPGTFEGKTVVIGGTAPSLQDVHPTSTSGRQEMSGPEIQAAMISTASDGFPLQSAPGALSFAMIVIGGFAAPLASLRLRVGWVAAIALALAVVFVVIGGYVAFEAGLVVKLVNPLVALAAGTVGALAVHYAGAAFDRQRTRDLFSRFVPAEVVNDLMDRTDGELRLGGVRRESTVMFSDLRGFTRFAETLEPDQVIEVLNRYLSAMSDVILDHGGTLVAYMGDGIMSVFGAPLEQEDHADRAVAAAREMVGRGLRDFNGWLREQGLGDGFRMGVGLNTGTVMSGNVGSERRLEYTAIGDTTNTAARIEAMTKGTPHQVLLAASTYEALRGQPEGLVFHGEMTVRGREATVTLWGLAEVGAAAESMATPEESDAPAATG